MYPILPHSTQQPTYNSALSQNATVSFETSSSSWNITCSKAVLVANDLFILWQLNVPGQIKKCDMGHIRETVNVQLPDNTKDPIQIHNYVLGKDWNWGQDLEKNLQFINSEDDFNRAFSVPASR